MIKITKTTIEVDHAEFYAEIKRVCEQAAKFNRSLIGAKFAIFKREMGLKLTPIQFFTLCAECGIEVKREVIFFDQFNK